MAYLLDSDIVIDHLADDATTTGLIIRIRGEGVAISAITYMEVYQGILASPQPPEALAKFDAFLEAVPIVPISDAIARRCAELRWNLQRSGKRVRPRALDLLTAATAVEHDFTLVTRNIVDYGDIPGLSLYRLS